MLVGSPVVEAPFGFFEMEMEGVFGQSLEPGEPHICHPPEALDAVDVDATARELVLGMIDAEVAIAEIDEPVEPRQPSELITEAGSTRPRIIPCNVAFEQSGTISV